MICEFTDALHFKRAVKVMDEFVDEATFLCIERSLIVQQFDPARIVHLEMEATPALYLADGVDSFSVSMKDLSKVLRGIGERDHLRLEADFTVGRFTVANGSRSYSIPLIEGCIAQPIDPSQIPFTAEVYVRAKHLMEALRTVKVISDHVALTVDDWGRLTISAVTENDWRTIDVVIPADTVRIEGVVKGTYIADYVLRMIRVAALTRLHLRLGMDMPLELAYVVGETIRARWLLAPRIEDDHEGAEEKGVSVPYPDPEQVERLILSALRKRPRHRDEIVEEGRQAGYGDAVIAAWLRLKDKSLIYHRGRGFWKLTSQREGGKRNG